MKENSVFLPAPSFHHLKTLFTLQSNRVYFPNRAAVRTDFLLCRFKFTFDPFGFMRAFQLVNKVLFRSVGDLQEIVSRKAGVD